MKTIEVLERDDGVNALESAGIQLREALSSAASNSGLEIVHSGPPALPFMHFAEDPDYALRHAFHRACFAQGLFFHPHHNWFVSLAHCSVEASQIGQRLEGAFEDTVRVSARTV